MEISKLFNIVANLFNFAAQLPDKYNYSIYL